MADLRWFKLELDQTGKVVSCVAVERAEQGDRCWVYVQAVSDATAREAASLRLIMTDAATRRPI